MATLTKVTTTQVPSPRAKVDKNSEIGSLWGKTSQNGEDYFTGEINVDNGKVSVIVFKNGFKKENSMEPDYRIYLRPPMSK